MNGRFAFPLAVALFICALSVVSNQYQGRKLFVELGRAQTLARELDIAWSQLELEQSTLAKSERISSVARTDLHMTETSSARVQYLIAGEGAKP